MNVIKNFISQNDLGFAGVYKMFDKSGKIIYIGKAKNLKNRLTSYLSPDRIKTENLVQNIHKIEIIKTQTEVDALILESTLVKDFQPKYNVLLKDDKSFVYLFINTAHRFPRLLKLRGKKNQTGFFFGPFVTTKYIDELINFLQKTFTFRTCSDAEITNRIKPCIEYQLGRCSAPCVNLTTKEDYAKNIEAIMEFLKSGYKKYAKELTEKMKIYAENEEFDEAIKIRNKIEAFSSLGINSAFKFDLKKLDNTDVIAIKETSNNIFCFGFFIRNGVLNGEFSYSYEKTNDEHDVVKAILQIYLLNKKEPPKKVIINREITELESVLSIFFDKKIQVKSKNLLNDEKDILQTALLNIQDKESVKWESEFLLLKDFFKLPKIPEYIEVFDNSHLFSTFATGNLVCVSKNGFVKSKYRKYNFKIADTSDDYAMMYEVLTRRLKSKEKLPDFFVIDGGLGHKTTVLKAMNDTGIFVDFTCVAKGVDRNAGNETFFTKNEDYIKIHDKKLLYFLQNIRDEVHKFAITTHRRKREKIY